MHNTNDIQRQRMLESPMPKLIFSLSLPSIASQLVTVLYNTADTFFVAKIGTSATAAVGVVFSLMSLIQAVGFGVGMGAHSLISIQLGAKEDEEANRCGSSAFFAAILFGLLLLVGGLTWLEGLIRLLGSTETMLPYSCDYARYILIGAPIMCSSFTLSSILRAEGEANLAMWGLCIGGVLNIALDPLLIFGLNMGISGAAIATVAGQLVSFLILLSFFLRGRSLVKLSWRRVSHRLGDYLHILKLGLPTILRQGLATVASAMLNVQSAVFGDAAVAAMTIATKIYLLVRNIILGIGQGFQPVAGFNYGAKRFKRVREAFVFCCQFGTVICIAATVLLGLNAATVIRWFRDDPEVIRIGTTALYFACGVMPVMAYSTFVNQLFQCLGFSASASFLACCRQGVCFLPLIFLLPLIFGLGGVQAAQPAADLCTFLISVPFQIAFFRKHLPPEEPPMQP